MTIEQIRQNLIDEGINLDDVLILINADGNGYQVWQKQVAPNFARFADQQDLILSADVFYENMILEFKAEQHEMEIADLWYELMTGGEA